MRKDLSLADFAVIIQLPILWGDMDAFGHVNNVRYFRYFESARVHYFEQIGEMGEKEKSGIGPILKETSCKYLLPLVYPDNISVGCRTSRFSASEIEQEYLIHSQHQDQVAAVGMCRIVAYDYASLQKSSFPEQVLGLIEQIDSVQRQGQGLD